MNSQEIVLKAYEYASNITSDESLQDLIYSAYIEGYICATKEYTESIKSIKEAMYDTLKEIE